jgi:predicted nucleic acid-binding Zn ribbon protein
LAFKKLKIKNKIILLKNKKREYFRIILFYLIANLLELLVFMFMLYITFKMAVEK